ncbi:MAG TPA: glycosyl hydrolase [Pontiella sp.]
MIKYPALTAAIVQLFVLLPVHAESRIWTSRDGKTATAEFEKLDDDSVVLKKNGRTVRIPLDSLSDADQSYVREYMAEQVRQQQAPLQIFDIKDYRGNNAHLDPHRIYRDKEIPHDLNRRISSLILKKGYQLAIATEADGQGLSKVLIAARRDIRIPELSEQFNNNIRFIRVIPWKNVIKKGHCGGKDLLALKEGWYYTWTGSMSKNPSTGVQFVPMPYSHRKTLDSNWIENIIQRPGIEQILGFNEPDMAGHKKNNFLGIQKNAVEAMMPLMGTGLRIGGPNCKEEGPRKWYPEFMEEADDRMLRIDFMGVHWYDWGSRPSKNRNDEPKAIFNRFKQYLNQVHKKYNLPIWITEFNANPYRDTETQLEFMKLALPYLDSLDYVERYAWFQPNDYSGKDNLTAEDMNQLNLQDKSGGNGNFRETKGDTNSPLTAIGIFWSNHASVPAMGREVYLGSSNLCDDETEEK